MRSLLIVCGSDRHAQERALTAGADALILDLESAAAEDLRAEARATVRSLLERHGGTAGRARLFVRIHRFDSGAVHDDLEVVVPAAPDAIVLPRAAGGDDVQHLSSLLAVQEAEAGLGDGTTGILAIAGATAASIFRMSTFEEAGKRLCALAWAGEDLAADIRCENARSPRDRLAGPCGLARSLTLIAARVAGVPPIDAITPDWQGTQALLADCEQARRDGFSGKLAVNPTQVAIINQVFARSPRELPSRV